MPFASSPSAAYTTIIVKEVDGSPSVSASTLRVPNGSLTDDGSGQVTLATGGGGFGSPLTVRDIDTSPSVGNVNTLEFTNGLVSDQSGGVARVTISSSSALTEIEDYTVTGSVAASKSFSSLGSYRHLQILWTAKGDTNAADTLNMRFNGDTGANYSFQQTLDQDTATGTVGTITMTRFQPGDTPPDNFTSAFACGRIIIFDYLATDRFKCMLAESWGALLSGDNTSLRLGRMGGMWRSTSAITSVSFFLEGDNLQIGSNFTLYGIS